MRTLLLLLDLARSRSALLSLGEPALGALLAAGGLPSARVILLGLLAATAGYFCVYALNDLLDLRADRQEIELASGHPQECRPEVTHIDITTLRHPVAAGALPLWAAVLWVVALGVVGLVAAYLLRPLCAWLFLGCAALQIIYCSLRRRTWLKVVPAGLMVGAGGLAGWFAAGDLSWGTFAFFMLLVLWEIADATSQTTWPMWSTTLGGNPTLASVRGPAVATRAIVAGAALMPVVAMLQPAPWPGRLLLAVAALLTMTCPALIMQRRPRPGAAQRYFNRASIYPAVAAGCLIVLWSIHPTGA
jgi:4-hydroxybenzoate polyprenyltransferase